MDTEIATRERSDYAQRPGCPEFEILLPEGTMTENMWLVWV